MSNEFNRIKKRFLIEAIIKSAACALSAGLFAVGAVLLGLKLGDSAINAGYYVLIGLGAAFAAGAPVFFLLRPCRWIHSQLSNIQIVHMFGSIYFRLLVSMSSMRYTLLSEYISCEMIPSTSSL